VGEQKKVAARLYQETRQMLLRRIVEGTLVHVDETPIVTQGKRGYVWVFCNFDDVVYFCSESREAETMQKLLKGFKESWSRTSIQHTIRWSARSKSA
jgi:transposase-like protein